MNRDIILDAWRGVAILMVIAHHLLYFHYETTYAVVRFFAEKSGPLGVKIFFVVSGYIITRLMLEEEHKQGKLGLYDFYIKRAFRILPPYLFYIAGIVGFSALQWVPLSLSDVLRALTFTCNTGLECNWQVVHTWTLAVEMQFYVMWPLIFVLLPARWRERFLLGLIGILVVFSAFEILLARGWIDNGASFACIALGALYALSPMFRDALTRYGLQAIGAGILLVAGLSLAHWSTAAHVLYRAFIPLTLAVAVFSAYRIPSLGASNMVWLLSRVGLVSYSLYLWQQVFLAPASNYLHPSFLQYFIGMAVLCLISYVAIEKPFVRLGRRFLRSKKESRYPAEPEVPAL